jgi:PAS domain S-box-containing protein
MPAVNTDSSAGSEASHPPAGRGEHRVAPACTADAGAVRPGSASALEHVADWLPQLIWIASGDGTAEFFNRRCYEYLGVSPGDLERLEDALRLAHPEDRARVDAAWRSALQTGEPYEIEFRLRRHDGMYRRFLVRATPQRGADGAVLHWFGSCTDVEDSRAVQDALQRTADRLELLAELQAGFNAARSPEELVERTAARLAERLRLAHCLIVEVEPHAGRAIVLHDHHAPGLGSLAGEYRIDDFHPPDERAALAEGSAVIVDDVYDAPRSQVTADGFAALGIRALANAPYLAEREWRFVVSAMHAAPHAWSDDEVELLVEVAARLYPRLEALRSAAALKDSERRFREIADHVSQFAWTADESGSIYWYNRRWYEYTGASPERMHGWGWQAVHHPDHVARVVARFRRCIEDGESWEDTFPLRGRDGGYRWFLSRAVPIRDEAGRVVRWFGTNTDVTEQRAAEEALREADRRKDVFLATLSHELRNPLAPIRTAAAVLDRPALPPAQLAWASGVIRRQVGHMALLLDDLLDVSRITRGKLQLKRERVLLTAVVDGALEAAQPMIERRQHRLELALPADDVWLHADPLRLSQVVSNLLTNAAKYTDACGTITLAAEVHGAELTIRVRDTGIGLPTDALARIFTMFSQVDDAAGRAEGGLGIGLALVRGLVELHGGAIVAHSAGPGCGSEFVASLPIVTGAVDVVSATGAEPPVAATAHWRVLIVDDKRDAADSLALLLGLNGHETRTAYSGQSALLAAATFRPDAALLDIGMPDMDGYALAQALRAEPWAAALCLAALTGWGQDHDKQRARAAGFDRHFTKPVDPEVVEAWLSGAGADRREPDARR